MTRYSRSAIPGRNAAGAREGGPDGLFFPDRDSRPAANDGGPVHPVEPGEAEALLSEANRDRRQNNDRRKAVLDRRTPTGRRQADFVPLREDPLAFRHTDDGKRGPLMLLGAVGLVGVFGFVVWSAYRDGLKTDAGEDVPVLAQSGGFKRAETAALDTDTRAPVRAEVLEALDGPPATGAAAQETRAPPPPPAAPVALKSPPASIARPPAAKPAPAPAPATTSAAARPPKPAATQTIPAPPAIAASSAAVALKPSRTFISGGPWLAQLAAASTEAAANAEKARRLKADPELFAGAEWVIVPADVEGKTRYRLRVGSFAAKPDADAFCVAFKARGGNCFSAPR